MRPTLEQLRLDWREEMLSILGNGIPGGRVDICYLEAFCRAGSHDRDWHETVIPHETRLLEAEASGRRLRLESRLADGVVVSHLITCGADEVDFRVTATNPTPSPSEAHWAQPCIRVGTFTGTADARDPYDYIRRCFIFEDGHPAFMPVFGWATEARYVPGQVWRAPGVSPDDVNPRPLHPRAAWNGLIGCRSGDETMLLATAWQPYQELFQGVIQCIHSDFRIGGLQPGESKSIRGKLYIVPNDVDALLRRYGRDFPEHVTASLSNGDETR